MTINSSLLTGVSGLLAQSAALSAISNNIANANTVGYKTEDTSFQDMVTNPSTRGDTGSGGVLAQAAQLVTDQGTLTQTTSSTDLGIYGSGFFVTTATPSAGVTDARNFTRAGSFTVDATGNLVNAAGGYLQGWPVNADGTVTVSPSSVASLQTINVGSATGGAVSATTQASVNANLNATTTAGTTAAAYTAGSMATYTNSDGTSGTKPDFTVSIPVSDSQGGQRTLSLDVLKTGANTWTAEMVAPAGETTSANNVVASGTLVFKSDGTLDTTNSTLTDTSGNSLLGAAGKLALNWSATSGVQGTQTIAMNLGSLTQYASASVTQAVDANGTQFGNLTGVTIDDQGYVTAAYDNGVTHKIAQVAIATFQNPDGLTSVSGDNYQVSATSGTYNLKEAGTGGAGTITPKTLEASTVDLSQQFAGLIVTQQAYSASTKILTTADQMLQQLISIKQ